MYAMTMHGKNIEGGVKHVNMPSTDELRSRYKNDKYSQLFLEGRESNPVSPVYTNSPDIMQRR